jgi:hypothetical protein
MPIITTRAKDYNFPETSAAVLPVDAADPGLTKAGAPDMFMGAVTLTSLTATFQATGFQHCYLKVYDAVDAFDSDLAAGLIEPLWILSLRGESDLLTPNAALLTFPDGFVFTKGITLRATKNGGTGTATGDLDPEGYVGVRLMGRKS